VLVFVFYNFQYFVENFLSFFKNRKPNSIFLSENPKWVKTRHFGKKFNENVEKVLSKIKYNDEYFKHGCIHFKTSDKLLKEGLAEYGLVNDDNELITEYRIFNPCIIENFKLYL
jgi:hypothetical protein